MQGQNVPKEGKIDLKYSLSSVEPVDNDEAEEQNMPVEFVPLDELRDAILAGRIANTSLVVGGLAAHAARSVAWECLRPAEADWPFRDHLARNDRIFRR